jgi:2-oxoglutarate ferredoxin oxidoreductase subunit beta
MAGAAVRCAAGLTSMITIYLALCQGCGHNSIGSQIIAAAYDVSLVPEKVLKFSGIGCSSKSPAYFMNRSFAFNSLHGRMPSLATGALFADTTLKGLGVSGDGDTASIGMGQFKHLMRRNLNMVYIVENNGVYGLTKGQFSATAEQAEPKKQNQCLHADRPVPGASLAALSSLRSFAGDPKQVKELLKAALSHDGIALLDIISPCVTFNNQEDAYHSYPWGKDHEAPLHDITFVPPREEIMLEADMVEGDIREVELHDGSTIVLKKIEKDYDPTDRVAAMRLLEESQRNNWMITGLVYVDGSKPSLTRQYNLVDSPLNRLGDEDLRPSRESIAEINAMMF